MSNPTQFQAIGATPVTGIISEFGPQTKTEAEVKQYAEVGAYAVGSFFGGPVGATAAAQAVDLLISVLGLAGVFGSGAVSRPQPNPYALEHFRAIGRVPISPGFLKHHPNYLSHHPHARES